MTKHLSTKGWLHPRPVAPPFQRQLIREQVFRNNLLRAQKPMAPQQVTATSVRVLCGPGAIVEDMIRSSDHLSLSLFLAMVKIYGMPQPDLVAPKRLTWLRRDVCYGS